MLKVDLKRSPKALKILIPECPTDQIFLSFPELPEIKLLANLCDFQLEDHKLVKVVPLDEMEIDMSSSAIEFVNYIPSHKALIVNFWNSSCHVYKNVPDVLYAALTIAESKGKFFHQFIQKKYQSKQIPDDFTVEDVKASLQEELEVERDCSLSMAEVYRKIQCPKVLSEYFQKASSVAEKIEIMENPNFDWTPHGEEIKQSFWLSYYVLELNSLKNENILKKWSNLQNEVLLEKQTHQLLSSPILKKETISIIVPQWAIYSNNIKGLKTIPEFQYIEFKGQKLKKGYAIMRMDSEGNLNLVKCNLST